MTEEELPPYIIGINYNDIKACDYRGAICGHGPVGFVTPLLQKKRHRWVCAQCISLPSKAHKYTLVCGHIQRLEKLEGFNIYDGEKYPEDLQSIKTMLIQLSELYMEWTERRMQDTLINLRLRNQVNPEQLENLLTNGEAQWNELVQEFKKLKSDAEINAFQSKMAKYESSNMQRYHDLAVLCYLSKDVQDKWKENYKPVSNNIMMMQIFNENILTDLDDVAKDLQKAFLEYNSHYDFLVETLKAASVQAAPKTIPEEDETPELEE